MRVIFLNRFYWPDEPATAQLLTDLCAALVRRGCRVTVITTSPAGVLVPAREIHDGVEILRVRGTRWGRHSLLGRAADFATFALGALFRLLTFARPRDTVVCLTDPPLLGIGAWLVARLCGARLVHWVQDIYPELAISLAGQRWLAAVRPLRNLAWRRADACVTLGGDMARVLTAAGVAPANLHVIANWGPARLAPASPAAVDALRAEWGFAGKFVVAYSGNLGRVHDLDPVLDLAAALRDEPGIAFAFIGGGARQPALRLAAAGRGLARVHFFPSQPRAQLAVSLSVGDLHLVTLLPGCERYVFPSKLYGVTAVGRPVLFLGPRASELAALVRAHDLGLAFSREEIPAIAAAVRALGRDPAARARHAAAALRFAAAGGVEVASAQWSSLLGGPS